MSCSAFSSAFALSVTNRDGIDQKITITEGEKQRDEVIAPSRTLSGVCPAGCVIKLENNEEYEFDGNEIVSIEEGLMFLDEPAQEETAEGGVDKLATEAPVAVVPPAPDGKAAPQPAGK